MRGLAKRLIVKEPDIKPWIPEQWDEETDVVVAGFGGAGAVTAVIAKDAGAEVLILEKQSPHKHTPGGSQIL
jgi:choline dehydrogenase-like flavoprotein